tara:strand:- start:80 stop:1483 length:1404 start_codon:yes stop_codon:yes gene_type:complete
MTAIVWFRNDLRLTDNAALFKAIQSHDTIIPLYIMDPNSPLILGDAQKWWLHLSLKSLQESLEKKNINLCLKKGDSLAILNNLIEKHEVSSVYWNIVYEPKHLQQDSIIKSALEKEDITVNTFNASLLIDVDKIKTQDDGFYQVFTPFWKTCLSSIEVHDEQNVSNWPSSPELQSDSIDEWDLLPTNPNWAASFSNFWQPGESSALKKLEQFIESNLNNYKTGRDTPSKEATSKLSPHLHFGEISPHQIWRAIQNLKGQADFKTNAIETYLSEIGWREFCHYLLFHFPKLAQNNFRDKFDNFQWSFDEEQFNCWKKGLTGFPIVDAGMRELWHSGYMHNRVRMIVASFLTKDLLIDWRKGAEWFEHTLLDADLANNRAGWQWTAGCGADAAPFFRVFNPILQGEKFDPDGKYIKKWVPELENLEKKYIHEPWKAKNNDIDMNYPNPIVDHSDARKKALELYNKIKDD